MIVYLITDSVNGKRYVGQTRRPLDARFAQHEKVAGRANACRALSDAMIAHGLQSKDISVPPEAKRDEPRRGAFNRTLGPRAG